MVESTSPATPFSAAVGAVGIPFLVQGSVAAPQSPPPIAVLQTERPNERL